MTQTNDTFALTQDDFSNIFTDRVSIYNTHNFFNAHGLEQISNQAGIDFKAVGKEINKNRATWIEAEFVNEPLFRRNLSYENAIQILGFSLGARSLKKMEELFRPAISKDDRLAKFNAWLTLDVFMTAANRFSHLYTNEFWNSIDQGRIDDDLFMAFYTMHCLAHDTVCNGQQPSMAEQAFLVVKSLEMTNSSSDILIQTEANFIETLELLRKTSDFFYKKTNKGIFDCDLKSFYQAASEATGLSVEKLCTQVNSVFDGTCDLSSASSVIKLFDLDISFS